MIDALMAGAVVGATLGFAVIVFWSVLRVGIWFIEEIFD